MNVVIPERARGWVERGQALLAERKVAEALAALAAARELDPEPAHTAGARWMAHMLLGDFAGAWRVSDEVLAAMAPGEFDRPDRPYHLRQVWNGTPLSGRAVLVRCYHGLGDTIQFIRYVPLLRGVARSVAVQAEPRLFGLLGTVAGIDQLVVLGDKDPEFEVDVECMELAYVFRSRPDALPVGVPYLSAPEVTADRRRFRVGLAWAAGGWDGGRRSVPPAMFRALQAIPGIDWICLQRGEGLAGLRADDGLRFAEPIDACEDLMAAASRLCSLDLVISVDTVTAHLAGALAVRAWVLLSHAADWRWMLGREDTPWYPTMLLFRQPTEGDWETPVERIRRRLAEVASRQNTTF